jgi:hypothetical protein
MARAAKTSAETRFMMTTWRGREAVATASELHSILRSLYRPCDAAIDPRFRVLLSASFHMVDAR